MAFCGTEHNGEGFNSTALCGKCNTIELPNANASIDSVEVEILDSFVDRETIIVPFFVGKVHQQTIRVIGADIIFTLCPPHPDIARASLYICIWNEEPISKLIHHYT